jgi:DNA modification methylase
MAEPYGGPLPADYHDRIVARNISDLKHYGRRTREHPEAQIGLVVQSLKTFGFLEPVLIDELDQVLVGYGRIEAAKRMGWTSVPTIMVSHLTPEQKRAYMITANRTAEKAGWNKEALAQELADLMRLDVEFDLDVTGFTIEEREALVFGQNRSAEAEDDLPAVQSDTVTRSGDLWVCGDHRLLHGDALDAASYATLLEGEPVQAVFTDPPYNVPTQGHITGNAAHGDFVQASGEMSEAEFAAFLVTLMERVVQVLAPGGLVYACMDWRSIAALIEAVGEAGLKLLNLIVWAKTQAAMGSMYRSQHELIALASKSGGPHLNNIQLGRYGRNRSNVWTYDGVNGFGADKARLRALHPTVKSAALVRDALLDCTRPADLVCDPFSGSSTTMIACETVGRRARMMELDPKYVDVGVRRWQDFTGRDAVHAITGETFAQTARGRAAESSERPPVRTRTRAA